MFVVECPCLLAILQNEPEKDAFEAVLAGDDRYMVSAINLHEALCVMRGRHGPAGVARVWDLFDGAEIELMPFDELQVRAAAAAFDRCGKGLNSKPALSLADCAAYALAKTMSAHLLFKGDDFVNTEYHARLNFPGPARQPRPLAISPIFR